MLNKEQLEKEIKIVKNAYEEEIGKNGGMDGTVQSLILKSKLEMLNDLKIKYYKADKKLVEKFREDDLFCPKCHCPQEGTGTITETEGDYKCEVCGEIFHYSYNKLNGEWSSFEEE